jgi:hypothetical protein
MQSEIPSRPLPSSLASFAVGKPLTFMASGKARKIADDDPLRNMI